VAARGVARANLDDDAPAYHQLFVWGEDRLHPVAVGALEVTRKDNLSWIRGDLFVDPVERRKGHGTTLLGHLEETARQLGRSSLLFWSSKTPPNAVEVRIDPSLRATATTSSRRTSNGSSPGHAQMVNSTSSGTSGVCTPATTRSSRGEVRPPKGCWEVARTCQPSCPLRYPHGLWTGGRALGRAPRSPARTTGRRDGSRSFGIGRATPSEHDARGI